MKYNWHTTLASNVLKEDKLVVHATESVFGIGASIYSFNALSTIKSIKERNDAGNFLVIVANLEQACRLISLNVPYRKQIVSSWPGHTSWILPALDSAPHWLIDDEGFIGVRMTSHSQAVELCKRAGPLISTSANTKGKSPALNLRIARNYLGKRIDYYVPGKLGGELSPSRIQNGLSGKLIRG